MTVDSPRAGGGLADRARDDALAGSRYLTLPDRVTIQVGVRAGWSHARIAAEIGRDRTVVWREIWRDRAPDGVYYATRAHNHAHQGRRRPKRPVLAGRPELARFVEDAMDEGWLPKLISRALREMFPDDGTMQISHETIYRTLCVQTRGTLRVDLAKQLSTGRAKRVTRGSRRSSSPYKYAFKLSDRAAEVADRAVPGHWEGDFDFRLRRDRDRHPGRAVEPFRVAVAPARRRHHELADYRRITAELNGPDFCDPHSHWQRGSNENTNRLLRHWFEKDQISPFTSRPNSPESRTH